MLINKEYNLAVALLQFKKSYLALVDASKAMPDYDASNCYPFYMLDFEEIGPAVSQWCSVHASELLAQVPDRVLNPACIRCSHYVKRGPVYCALQGCFNHPEIVFSKDAIAPALLQYGIDIKDMTEEAAFVAYLQFCDKLEKERCEVNE